MKKNWKKGSENYEEMKEDVVNAFIEVLPEYVDEFSDFADRVFDLEKMVGDRLAALPPEDFEQMLHPVFQEDEWMITCLGGVLGVIVGTLQGMALGA